jgi:N-hydroxyarylamine O-acetyltransferase
MEMIMTFDLMGYLDRISHHPQDKTPSLRGLVDLQRAQLMAIPFENTVPYLGGVPDLSEDGLMHRIVRMAMGGYCLELNALFECALLTLGYETTPILGRVRMGAPSGGPRAHLAQIVRLDGTDWLADTGFGGPGPDVPMAIGSDTPVLTPLGTFRLRNDRATDEVVLEKLTPEGWFSLYGFDRAPVTQNDRLTANITCATGEASPFPNHLMTNRVTGTGRIGLFDTTLSHGDQIERITSPSRLEAVMAGLFDLRLDEQTLARIWQRLQSADRQASCA